MKKVILGFLIGAIGGAVAALFDKDLLIVEEYSHVIVVSLGFLIGVLLSQIDNRK